MTQDKVKEILSKVLNGTGATADEYVVILSDYEAKEKKLKEALAQVKEVINNIETSMVEYINKEGVIPYNVDGKDKEFYVKEKVSILRNKAAMDDETFEKLVEEIYPVAVNNRVVTDIDMDALSTLFAGSAIDSRLSSAFTTSTSTKLASRVAKKKKVVEEEEATPVVPTLEGGDE